MKIQTSFIEVVTGSDLVTHRLPVMVALGRRPGPVVWLTGCVHGDEIGGTVVIQEVFRRLRKDGLETGAVHAFPLMNPYGFQTASRMIAVSGEDLNRVFPGDQQGSLAARIAGNIFTSILTTRPTLVLDLHNDWRRSIPYALVDPYPGLRLREVYQLVRKFAAASGLPVVRDQGPGGADLPTGTLSHELVRAGVPALTLELGESLIVNEQNVASGVASVFRILAELGLVEPRDEEIAYRVPRAYRRRMLDYHDRPLTTTNGIVRFAVAPGDVVERGTVVARIQDTFGDLRETLEASLPGIVLGHDDSAVSYPGKPLLAFAVVRPTASRPGGRAPG